MRRALPLAILMLTLTCNFPVPAQVSDIAVVVNPHNPVSGLTMAQLRKLFAGQKRSWPGGQPVRLFVRAPGTRERLAVLRLLGMSESEYKQYWTSQVFRGEAQAEPVTVPSNGIQKEAILAFPGGIVLMDSRDVKPPLKVVPIEGRLPDTPGYPIQ